MSISHSLRLMIVTLFISCAHIPIGQSDPIVGGIEGSAHVVSHSRWFETLHHVQLDADLTVTLKQGARPYLSIEAENNLMPYIQFKQSDDRLIISASRLIKPKMPIVITLTLNELKGLEVNGNGVVNGHQLGSHSLSLTINGNGQINLSEIDAHDISSQINGNGLISLSGRASQHFIQMVGDGTCEALDLISQTALVNIVGDGISHINVQRYLEVKVEGQGKVYYKGTPKISPQRHEQSNAVNKINE